VAPGPSAARTGFTDIVFFVDHTDHQTDDGLLHMVDTPQRLEAVGSEPFWKPEPRQPDPQR
jgi:hypothetical protein